MPAKNCWAPEAYREEGVRKKDPARKDREAISRYIDF